MNSKLTLPTLFFLLGASIANPVQAEDSKPTISQSSKNIANLKIDKRLGLLKKPWKVPAFLTLGTIKFPDLFGHKQARFFQPGPPPYFQQPEGANDAGLSTLVPTTMSAPAPKTTTAATTSAAPAMTGGGGGGGTPPGGPTSPGGLP